MAAEADRSLDGLVVIDLCDDRAGSVAGMLLADLGASVTRIVTSDGTHERPSPRVHPDPVCWDRGKGIDTVDSFAPTDPRLRAHLATADVVLVEGGPANLSANGLDPAELSAAHPRLVVVWVPPYGADGTAIRDLPADPLLLSAIGAYAMHQPAVDPEAPIAPVVPVAEYIQGSIAASAAVAGVLERVRSGRGQVATISGIDAVGALLATLVNDALDVEEVFRSGRNAKGGPSFRSYRCADDEMLFLATLVAPLFFKALEVLDLFEVMVIEGVDGEFLHLFRPEPGAIAARMLEERFATQPRQYWLERLEAAGVPAEPVLTRDDWVVSEPFLKAAATTAFEHPDAGPVVTPGHPVRLRDRGAAVDPSVVWPGRRGGSRPGPLAGLRVVDLAGFVAGPFAPTLLAFWGADVVKVETPDGDPYRLYTVSYLAVNQAKHSVVLDVRDVDDRRKFEELVGGADVLVDNLRPASRDKLGLDDESLDRINPHLVHGRVTAFAEHGVTADRPGFDPSIQALSGMMVAAGGEATPLNTTTPVHDVASACSLALGVLAGLWRRASVGSPSKVSGSLAASSALLQCAELTSFDGRPPCAVGSVDFVGAAASHRFYRTSDGAIGVATDLDGLRAMFTALGGPAPSAIDEAPDGPTASGLERCIAGLSTAAVLAALDAAGVPAARASGPTWADDPHLLANRLAHVVIEPNFGRCRVMRGAGDWSRSGTAPAAAMVPAGADTDRLTRLGWSALG